MTQTNFEMVKETLASKTNGIAFIEITEFQSREEKSVVFLTDGGEYGIALFKVKKNGDVDLRTLKIKEKDLLKTELKAELQAIANPEHVNTAAQNVDDNAENPLVGRTVKSQHGTGVIIGNSGPFYEIAFDGEHGKFYGWETDFEVLSDNNSIQAGFDALHSLKLNTDHRRKIPAITRTAFEYQERYAKPLSMYSQFIDYQPSKTEAMEMIGCYKKGRLILTEGEIAGLRSRLQRNRMFTSWML